MNANNAHPQRLGQAQDRLGMATEKALVLLVELPVVGAQRVTWDQSLDAIVGQVDRRSIGGQRHDHTV